MDDNNIPDGGGRTQLSLEPLALDGCAACSVRFIADLIETVYDKEVHGSGDKIIVALIVRRAGISIPWQVEIIQIRARQIILCLPCIIIIMVAQSGKEPVDRGLACRAGCSGCRD